MSTTTRNEAAELFIGAVMKALDTAFEPDPIHPTTWKELLRPHVEGTMRQALAAERHALVERIRERITAAVDPDNWGPADFVEQLVLPILDEEGAS